MPPFRQPTFQERAALATKAKGDALEKLRAKPPVDEAVVAERREAERLRDAAQQKARQDHLAARALAKARKEERLAEIPASPPPPEPVRTDAELKAIRDAKYAARKMRKGGR
jgi:Family of unknown function (DUF6481)